MFRDSRSVSLDAWPHQPIPEWWLFYLVDKMEVELRGKNKIKVEIDEEDYDRVMQHAWSYCGKINNTYPTTSINNKNIALHRFILNAIKGQIIDHIDRNRLNNKKNNLRFCTNTQNQWNSCKQKNNTTGYKGVTIFKRNKKKPYYSQIWVNKKNIYLGYFKTKEEAYEAYCEAAIKYFGEYACFG